VEEAGLNCSGYVLTRQQLDVQHHSEITNDEDGFTCTGAVYMASLLGGIFFRLIAVSNTSGSVLWTFNYKPFDAHQRLTSTKQSLGLTSSEERQIVDSAECPACHRRTDGEAGHVSQLAREVLRVLDERLRTAYGTLWNSIIQRQYNRFIISYCQLLSDETIFDHRWRCRSGWRSDILDLIPEELSSYSSAVSRMAVRNGRFVNFHSVHT